MSAQITAPADTAAARAPDGPARLAGAGTDGVDRRARPGPSYLAPDLVVTGRLDCAGDVEIDADVRGEVAVTRLKVGPQGRLRASIEADDAVISGNVVGVIKARGITLTDGCACLGELQYEQLGMEPEARFEGRMVPVIDGNARTHAGQTVRTAQPARSVPRPVPRIPRHVAAVEDPPPSRHAGWRMALVAAVLIGAAVGGAVFVSPVVRDWRSALVDHVRQPGPAPAVPAALPNAGPDAAGDPAVDSQPEVSGDPAPDVPARASDMPEDGAEDEPIRSVAPPLPVRPPVPDTASPEPAPSNPVPSDDGISGDAAPDAAGPSAAPATPPIRQRPATVVEPPLAEPVPARPPPVAPPPVTAPPAVAPPAVTPPPVVAPAAVTPPVPLPADTGPPAEVEAIEDAPLAPEVAPPDDASPAPAQPDAASDGAGAAGADPVVRPLPAVKPEVTDPPADPAATPPTPAPQAPAGAPESGTPAGTPAGTGANGNECVWVRQCESDDPERCVSVRRCDY